MNPLSLTKSPLFKTRPQGPLPGDILLFTDAPGLTKVIPWFTNSRYYHVGLYEGGPFSLEARVPGVIRRDISQDKQLVFRFIPMPREGAQIALDFARKNLGANYDPLDILAIMINHTFPKLRLNYSNETRFTCGELVAEAWQEAGVDLFPGIKSELVVPGDFARYLPVDARDRVYRQGKWIYEPMDA